MQSKHVRSRTGQLLKKARRDVGMSAKVLAEAVEERSNGKVKWNTNSVYAIENGRARISKDVQEILCSVLSIDRETFSADESAVATVYESRVSQNATEKQYIAEYAAKLIHDVYPGDAIAIDGGSSTFGIVNSLCRQIRTGESSIGLIITNHLEALRCLAREMVSDHPIVHATGGILRPSRETFIGHTAARTIEDHRFQVSIVGANGFDPPDLLTMSEQEYHVKHAMINGASTVIFPIDSSKWAYHAGKKLIGLDDIVKDGRRAVLITAYPVTDSIDREDQPLETAFHKERVRQLDAAMRKLVSFSGADTQVRMAIVSSSAGESEQLNVKEIIHADRKMISGSEFLKRPIEVWYADAVAGTVSVETEVKLGLVFAFELSNSHGT